MIHFRKRQLSCWDKAQGYSDNSEKWTKIYSFENENELFKWIAKELPFTASVNVFTGEPEEFHLRISGHGVQHCFQHDTKGGMLIGFITYEDGEIKPDFDKQDLDNKIITLMKSIFDHGNFEVETFNESVLVELMKMRGTPIEVSKNPRDSENDLRTWLKEENEKYRYEN